MGLVPQPWADGSTAVIYDVEPGQAHGRRLALRFHPDGSVTEFEAPPLQRLRAPAWRTGRGGMRSDGPVSVVQQLEDTPFLPARRAAQPVAGQEVTSFS